MKRSFLVSLSVHVTLLVGLLVPFGGRADVSSSNLIYEVSLVSLPEGLAGTGHPPSGAAEPPDATLATAKPKKETKSVALKPPEKDTNKDKKTTGQKKPAETKPETKTAVKGRSGPDSDLHSLVNGSGGPGASGGTGIPGFSSQLQLDIENFEFSYYLVAVRNKVSSNWSPPAGVMAVGGKVRTVTYFRIQRNGRISDIKIEVSSGLNLFDQSALRAILKSEPFPPLPRGFSENSLGVHFGFEYAR